MGGVDSEQPLVLLRLHNWSVGNASGILKLCGTCNLLQHFVLVLGGHNLL